MDDIENRLFSAACDVSLEDMRRAAASNTDPGISAVAHAISFVALCSESGQDPGDLLQRVRVRMAQELVGRKAKVPQ